MAEAETIRRFRFCGKRNQNVRELSGCSEGQYPICSWIAVRLFLSRDDLKSTPRYIRRSPKKPKEIILEPHISRETLEYHHDKHHNAYVTNLNNLIKDTDNEGKSLEEIIRSAAPGGKRGMRVHSSSKVSTLKVTTTLAVVCRSVSATSIATLERPMA